MSKVIYIENVLGSRAVDETNIPVERSKKVKVNRETLGLKARVQPLSKK